MKSNPTSPSSDCSARSDWFRHSVLFWSSQVDDRNEADDVHTPTRKLSSALCSSQESVSSLTHVTENSNDSLQNMQLPVENVHKLSGNPPHKLNDSTEYVEPTKKGSTFDPSELLRQVEELENCFRQTPSLQEVSRIPSEELKESSKETSPHLTLEFPDGSSIKNNPLYIQAEKNHRDHNTKRKLTTMNKVDDIDTGRVKDQQKVMDELTLHENNISLDSSLENVKMLLDIVETAVVNDELTRLDPSTKDSSSNETQSDTTKDTDNNTIQLDDSSSLITTIQSKNKALNQLSRSKQEITKDGEYNNKSYFINNNIKEVEVNDDNITEISTKLDESDTHSKKTDKHNKTVNESHTKLDESDTHSYTTDRRIINSIQKVQDTLFEISREINCSHEKGKYTRDPNKVMTNILLNIKPPNDIDTQPRKNSLNKEIVVNEIIETYKETNVMASSRDYYDVMSTNEELFEESKKFHLKSEVLLKQIDQLIDIEHTEEKIRPKNKYPAISRNAHKNHGPLERLDSGLHSTSSDSNSPYPSPIAVRASPTQLLQNTDPNNFEQSRNINETILESLKEYNDSVFNDDSDFGSDWSPISTLDSVASSTRTRSNSVPRASYQKEAYINDIRSTNGNMSDSNIVRNSKLYSDSELHAIRKFLTLTTRCFDRGNVGLNATQSLEELALLPSIKEAIDKQRNELLEQREKQEDFLQQLGDLLLEIVTLKEEHTSVRTKQAKALSLLKKQLDFLKKHQSKAHNDVVDKVNDLNDKLNSSINMPGDQSSVSLPSSPMMSPVLKPNHMSINTSSRNQGQIIWKISDVMKKLTRIKSGLTDGALVSQPFQTNEYGYKMNGWLYLNGRGKSLGKYLSVYVCVLVGEYDAILTWPIQPTYKFTLIDQKSDTSKRHDHVKVRRVLDIAGKRTNVISQKGGIPRPSDGTKALIVGFDDFIAHEQLLERRYLSDDVLFLKIESEVA